MRIGVVRMTAAAMMMVAMAVAVAVIVVMIVAMVVAMAMVMIVPVIVAVVMRVRGIAVGADALHVMVMAFLRQPHLGLEAKHLLAVFAHLAVHVVGADHHLVQPVDEGFHHEIVRAEIGRLDELDIAMPRRHRVRLVVDAPHENAGEEEVGKHDDAPVAEPCLLYTSPSPRDS